MRVMISAPLVDVSLTLVITLHSTRTKIHAEERDGNSNLAALLSTRTPHCKTCFHLSAHRLGRRPLDLRVIRRAKEPNTPKVQQRIISQSTHTQHRATCRSAHSAEGLGFCKPAASLETGCFGRTAPDAARHSTETWTLPAKLRVATLRTFLPPTRSGPQSPEHRCTVKSVHFNSVTPTSLIAAPTARGARHG